MHRLIYICLVILLTSACGKEAADPVGSRESEGRGDHAVKYGLVVDVESVGQIHPDHQSTYRPAADHPGAAVIGECESDSLVVALLRRRSIGP